MEILGSILGFVLFFVHFLLPIKSLLINNCYIIFYIIGIIFFFILIYKILKDKKFTYDILFLVMTLWISNFIGFIYLNIFTSLTISFFCYLVSLICIIFLFKNIKKINKHYLKHSFILLLSYIYLLINFIKFI